MCVQHFRYSTSSTTEDYKKLYSDINRYKFQDYLKKIKKRCSCLLLEKGRYESLQRKERRCPLCNIEVEDLEHFMFKYPKFNVYPGFQRPV